jgi:hypothetical protein
MPRALPRVGVRDLRELCELGCFQLIHSGLQASRSAASADERGPRGDRRSEHACNCVLNEAEAASPAEGGFFLWTCHRLDGAEDSVWEMVGATWSLVCALGSPALTGCQQVKIT